MNRRPTFYLLPLLGLLLLSGTVSARKDPVPGSRAAEGPVVSLRETMNPTHSAMLGNQSSAGGELAREPY